MVPSALPLVPTDLHGMCDTQSRDDPFGLSKLDVYDTNILSAVALFSLYLLYGYCMLQLSSRSSALLASRDYMIEREVATPCCCLVSLCLQCCCLSCLLCLSILSCLLPLLSVLP